MLLSMSVPSVCGWPPPMICLYQEFHRASSEKHSSLQATDPDADAGTDTDIPHMPQSWRQKQYYHQVPTARMQYRAHDATGQYRPLLPAGGCFSEFHTRQGHGELRHQIMAFVPDHADVVNHGRCEQWPVDRHRDQGPVRFFRQPRPLHSGV